MEYPVVVAAQRERLGKGGSRALRRAGKIPAVCYSAGKPALHLTINPEEVLEILKTEMGENSVVQLRFEDGASSERMVMLKEVQRHPISRDLYHADLFELDMNKSLRVWVPLKFTGRSKGVHLGGILQIIRRDLEVECLPSQIPSEIEVDVTELDLGDAFHISDLQLAEGVRPIGEGRYTLVTVVAPTGAAEEEEEEEEGEGEGAEATAEA